MIVWQIVLCLFFLHVLVNSVRARSVKTEALKDSTSSEGASDETADPHDMNAPTKKLKSTENAGLTSESVKRFGRQIYGPAGYITGQINSIEPVNTGYYNEDYNSYSNNYWYCVNYHRGQYYFSYTIGYYVCDIRANRYG